MVFLAFCHIYVSRKSLCYLTGVGTMLAGVERVKRFLHKKEYEQFYEDVVYFENLLLNGWYKDV